MNSGVRRPRRFFAEPVWRRRGGDVLTKRLHFPYISSPSPKGWHARAETAVPHASRAVALPRKAGAVFWIENIAQRQTKIGSDRVCSARKPGNKKHGCGMYSSGLEALRLLKKQETSWRALRDDLEDFGADQGFFLTRLAPFSAGRSAVIKSKGM